MGRAVAFTGARRAELIDVADRAAGHGEVAGPTLVSLVSPGTELAGYVSGAPSAELPGYSAVFAIEEAGAGAEGLQPGQLVYCMGEHRSRQVHDAATVLALPAGMDPAVAVFARLAGVSMSTLATTAARPPDPVLVSGLGPVGNMAAQVFQLAGYQVIAHDPLVARVELALATGVRDAHVDLAAQTLPEPSLVLDCSGHEDAVIDGCRMVREGGEVVLVGVPWRQRSEASAHALLHAVFHRYVHLRSGWEWELPLLASPARTGSIIGNQAGALAWLADGRLRVDGLGLSLAPREASQAYEDLLGQRGPLTRVFDWRREDS